eukprot:CAMPEP_0114554380 /NCGR_PEP_ID=MMETSP0114-20121206/8182_1 /TAXON_ID=31324 /ORGANISM="Goniomonas sp, Strain m" /LENGTH=507 /DNA_ID=CAMNT_0001739429 /DNA_START=11 /DNA_END=1534 /DNA_ORIENTATION=+
MPKTLLFLFGLLVLAAATTDVSESDATEVVDDMSDATLEHEDVEEPEAAEIDEDVEQGSPAAKALRQKIRHQRQRTEACLGTFKALSQQEATEDKRRAAELKMLRAVKVMLVKLNHVKSTAAVEVRRKAVASLMMQLGAMDATERDYREVNGPNGITHLLNMLEAKLEREGKSGHRQLRLQQRKCQKSCHRTARLAAKLKKYQRIQRRKARALHRAASKSYFKQRGEARVMRKAYRKALANARKEFKQYNKEEALIKLMLNRVSVLEGVKDETADVESDENHSELAELDAMVSESKIPALSSVMLAITRKHAETRGVRKLLLDLLEAIQQERNKLKKALSKQRKAMRRAHHKLRHAAARRHHARKMARRAHHYAKHARRSHNKASARCSALPSRIRSLDARRKHHHHHRCMRRCHKRHARARKQAYTRAKRSQRRCQNRRAKYHKAHNPKYSKYASRKCALHVTKPPLAKCSAKCAHHKPKALIIPLHVEHVSKKMAAKLKPKSKAH